MEKMKRLELDDSNQSQAHDMKLKFQNYTNFLSLWCDVDIRYALRWRINNAEKENGI